MQGKKIEEDVVKHHVELRIKPLYVISISVFTLLVAVIIILFCFTMMVFMKAKQDYSQFYSFQQYKDNETFLTYEKRKELFVKKTLYIFDKYKVKYPADKRALIAGHIFDKWQETHISGYKCLATLYEESSFDNACVGKAGEITEAQFMKLTWAMITNGIHFPGCEKDTIFVIDRWFDYMRMLMNEFGSEDVAVVCYNMGQYKVKELDEDIVKISNYYKTNLKRTPYHLMIKSRESEFIALEVN